MSGLSSMVPSRCRQRPVGRLPGRCGSRGCRKRACFPVYGLAEASLAVTFPEPGEPCKRCCGPGTTCTGARLCRLKHCLAGAHELVCLGRPLPACEMHICDDQGKQLPEFTVGHVQIRGENVTRGYYRCPACDEAAFIDGWLDTGDLGLLTADGLYITGRCKDILFAGGKNWYPQDIEVALQHAAGIDAEKLAVCAVRSEDNSEDELLVFIQHRKALRRIFCASVRNCRRHWWRRQVCMPGRICRCIVCQEPVAANCSVTVWLRSLARENMNSCWVYSMRSRNPAVKPVTGECGTVITRSVPAIVPRSVNRYRSEPV